MIDIIIGPNKFSNGKNIIFYEEKKEPKYQGTPEFMAIKISEGFSPSMRTDMEELIYTLLFLLKKKLPWSDVKAKNFVDKIKKMNDIKKNINLDLLFLDCPNELI